jgi:hypothetical protein
MYQEQERQIITGGANMANKGFFHIGLSTLDLEKTVEFYENVLASELCGSTRSH